MNIDDFIEVCIVFKVNLILELFYGKLKFV